MKKILSLNEKYAKLPFQISFLSGFFFLISGICYSYSGASTGYVLLVIAFIVILSAQRMRKGKNNDLKDSGLTVLFFGVLNLISFIFILSGANLSDDLFFAGFITGFIASIFGLLGGLFAFMLSKQILNIKKAGEEE